MDKTFHIITFGCQMNVGDSDWLARALVLRGWRQVPEAEAWLFVVNTCSVRDKPEQKVYSELGRLAAYQRGKPGLTAAVGGCVGSVRVWSITSSRACRPKAPSQGVRGC